MFKILALCSFLLFAFMAGVIFGAKNNRMQNSTQTPQQTPKEPFLKESAQPTKTSDHTGVQAAPLRSVKKDIRVKNPFAGKSASRRPQKTSTKNGVSYTLVLASFSGKSSALRHVQDISRQGFDAFYFTTKIKGKTWHRVGMGSFPLKSKALGLKRELSGKKFTKGSLVSKIPSSIQ